MSTFAGDKPEGVSKNVAPGKSKLRDPNTLSNYDAWRTKHTTVDFEIDFNAKRLGGVVHLTVERLQKEQRKLVLDTSYLEINGVHIGKHEARYELAPSRTEPYGTPLNIEIDDQHESDSKSEITVSIAVQTTKDCTALQWLTPAQTSNKKHPYMFSQCQAIHARSILPCQDTPDVKSTYTFNIRSPLPVLTSGLPTGSKDFDRGTDIKPKTLLYTFHQKIPIPTYLVAIASGDVACASIGPRSTIWTGPEQLVAAQWEFEHHTEAYIDAIEKIVYPYAWTTYNLLILLPSFPYGGMENPVVTYCTPTLVSGDRANVDVIAHELSHSWSGNLVTNANWSSFALNEGWTTYLERRLQAVVQGGDKFRDFSAIIGWKALTDSIKQFGEEHEFTKMVPDLEGKDPDDAFSSVPYEKGFVFLYHLEKVLGIEKWDTFIPHYFAVWREKSVDIHEFKATLLSFFEKDAEANKKLQEVDWDAWFYKPGFPPKPEFDTTLADECYKLAYFWSALNDGRDKDFKPHARDIEGFVTSNQSVVFLETLQSNPKPLSPKLIELMGEVYSYTSSKNVEVTSRYLTLGLQGKAKSVYGPTAELLGRVGRMKFVRPLFRELMKCDLALAKKTFEQNRDFYHPICRSMMEKMLEKHEKGSK